MNFDELCRIMDSFPKQPEPIVGIVCRPNAFSAVKKIAEEGVHPLFGGIPVFIKVGQVQAHLTFRDQGALRRYLEEPSVI